MLKQITLLFLLRATFKAVPAALIITLAPTFANAADKVSNPDFMSSILFSNATDAGGASDVYVIFYV